jgi:hypothetical protein
LVTVFFEVDCSETGQFTSPVDRHAVAVYVILVLVVTVVRSSLAIIVVEVAAALAIAVALPLTAHASPMVVYQIGICVLGMGPHVCSPIAIVAPAFAPNSIEYSSMTSSSQVPLLTGGGSSHVGCELRDVGPDTHFDDRCSKSRECAVDGLGEGVLNLRPAFTPTRRMAVNTASAFWIVTGRNSKLPPLLEVCSAVSIHVNREELAFGIRNERLAHKVMLETFWSNIGMSIATPSLS